MNRYVDARGRDLMGEDEYGLWFGTELVPVTLEDYTEDGWRLRTRKRRFVVNGYLGASPFVAYVRASSAERARAYFEGWRVRDLTVG